MERPKGAARPTGHPRDWSTAPDRRSAARPPRRSRPALPWLLCQVALALAIAQLTRPIRRPGGTDLLLWLAMIAVSGAFLVLLAQINGLLAAVLALGLIVLAWRDLH